ncbi:hypothetical protein QYS49_00005 [Marivirga salinae]|uniref:Uncharacterized protein n=1 Tax=Marivirga salinarum TaxID=3059078 RepID=A0AA49GC03_9BACT|nr:hypothetical protein [Marivirga sp. BDSF4-3]WKK75908.2 hypothetical protein QYS49_00005 [Marivirga sp. BDSF4-3]
MNKDLVLKISREFTLETLEELKGNEIKLLKISLDEMKLGTGDVMVKIDELIKAKRDEKKF